MQPWSSRRLLVAAALWAGVTLIGALWLDVPIARAAARIDDAVIDAVRTGLRGLEIVLLLDLSKFAIGIGLVVLGLMAWRWRPGLARVFLYVGATHALTRLIAGLLKNVFGRHRPHEVPFDPTFFHDGGISFPSGHTAHVFALLFPLLVLRPRAGWIFAPVALYVLVARVLPGDHFLSDTTASAALAALFAALLRPIAPRTSPGAP